jgi:hypothetical protein
MSAADPKVTFTQDGGLGTITLRNPPMSQIGEAAPQGIRLQ